MYNMYIQRERERERGRERLLCLNAMLLFFCDFGFNERGKSMQIPWDISSRIQRSAFMNSKKSKQKCFDHYERNTKTNKTGLKNMSRITRFVAFILGNKSKHVFKQMELQKTTKRHADIFQLSSRL